jgi:hypothetical protein
VRLKEPDRPARVLNDRARGGRRLDHLYEAGRWPRAIQRMIRWRGLSETSPRHVCDRCDRLRHPAINEGFGYRIVYVEPFLLTDAVRALRGRPYPLPFVSEPVPTNAMLSRAIEGAFRGPPGIAGGG